MGFLVFRCMILCNSLKGVLIEKLLFFFFLLRTCFQSHFYGLYHSFCQPIRLRVIWWCFIRFTPYISNNKLRSSSQNSVAFSRSWVFGMQCLENKTLRICFDVELLSGTWITSGSEKESASINKSPTPVMYTWSICTQLHGCSSLGHECKIVCVKFLNSLYLFFLYVFRLLVNIPGTMLLIFLCSCYSTVDVMCNFYHELTVFLGELSDPHYKSLHVLSLTCILFLCRVFAPWNNFPIQFYLFVILSCRVLDHV